MLKGRPPFITSPTFDSVLVVETRSVGTSHACCASSARAGAANKPIAGISTPRMIATRDRI
jgi:hypothetical protein